MSEGWYAASLQDAGIGFVVHPGRGPRLVWVGPLGQWDDGWEVIGGAWQMGWQAHSVRVREL